MALPVLAAVLVSRCKGVDLTLTHRQVLVLAIQGAQITVDPSLYNFRFTQVRASFTRTCATAS